MMEIGYRMAALGWCGRSGGADGADMAFETGYQQYVYEYDLIQAGFECYLPWNIFNSLSEDSIHIVTPNLPNYTQAIDIVSHIHPAWDRLTQGARSLHTRNVYQILGRELNKPSQFCFLYAEPKSKTQVKGGTNTAFQLARRHNVETFNLYYIEDIERVRCLLTRLESQQADG
jgi:hypothetical protein